MQWSLCGCLELIDKSDLGETGTESVEQGIGLVQLLENQISVLTCVTNSGAYYHMEIKNVTTVHFHFLMFCLSKMI